MKLKNAFKKAGKFVVYAALINQLGMPLFQPISGTVGFLLSEKKEMNIEYIVEVRKRPGYESFNILDYLNLANFVTTKYKKEGDVCRHLSNYTFDYFQEIVEKDGRKDLSDKIRLCSGINSNVGHMWIEYQEKDKWLPYEATKGIYNLDKLKEYSEEGWNGKINAGFEKEQDIQSLPGTKIFYPTPNSLKGFGLLEIPLVIYNRIK